jgi:ArsR family transcriptional regulator
MRVQKYEPAEAIFKALANSKRLFILHTLGDKEMSVRDITGVMHAPMANVSQHLTVLRYARLVKTRRHGTRVYYKAIDPKILECCAIIQHFAKKRRML